MGKVVQSILIIVPSVLIGFGAQRLMDPAAATESHPDPDRDTIIPPSRASSLPESGENAPPEKGGAHLPQTPVTAYAAILHDRPIALLRFLDDPAGLAEVHQVATYLIEIGESDFLPTTSAMDVLFARWVEFGPHDAIEFGKRLRTRSRLGHGSGYEVSRAQRNFLARIYAIWLQMDHAAATASLEAQAIPNLRRVALKNYERGLIDDEEDPEEAGDFIASARALAEDPESLQSIRSIYDPMFDWAEDDPEAALAFASELPPGRFRHAALDAALRGLRQERPDLIANALANEPPSQWRTGQLISAAEKWGKLDPDACKAWLKTLPPGLGTDAIILGAAYSMSEKRPLEALALLEANDWHLMGMSAALRRTIHYTGGFSNGGGGEHIERLRALKSILLSVAKTDPRRALQVAGELALVQNPHHNINRPAYQRATLVNAVLEVWLESDREAARNFIAGMPDFEELSITRNVAWAGATPIEAAHFVATLEPGRRRNQLIQRIGGTIDTEEELAALAALPEEVRKPIESRALREMALKKPEVIAARLDGMTDAQVRDLLPSLVDGMQRSKSILETAEWLSAHADQPQITRGYEFLAQSWIRSDPEATADWVNSLPAGDGQDRAMVGMSDHLGEMAEHLGGKNDYPLALEWAGKISNAEQRNKTLEQTFVRWHRAEPQAAQQALDGASILAELSARIREKIGGSE